VKSAKPVTRCNLDRLDIVSSFVQDLAGASKREHPETHIRVGSIIGAHPRPDGPPSSFLASF
ncbi:hypothetical protein B296_00057381, partial [Ensete ventricosum]